MEFLEEVGESSPPLQSYSSFSGAGSVGGVNDAIRKEVYDRLIEIGNEEATSDPDFLEKLEAHFNCLPQSYVSDINMERVEDVLLHQKLLARARDSDIPVFHIRLSENICSRDDFDTEGVSAAPSFPHGSVNEDVNASCEWNCQGDVETCSMLEDLNLDVRNNNEEMISKLPADGSRGVEISNAVPIHEIIFSTTDKPKLLCQLSALLSDIGLNIREAHVFSTTDGYSLDVFVVDGWIEDIGNLYDAVNDAFASTRRSHPGPSNSSLIPEEAIFTETTPEEWEIDLGQLKIGEKVASGSSGDLHLGVYHSKDVAVKILRPEHLNTSAQAELSQEISVLRHIQHRNVIGFIGACTKSPHPLIVTEYMPGGSLYEYLRKNHPKLKLPQLLRFAIDVSEGMEYLHQNSIIHRDLKTANLLLDASNVVKVADFGIARFQSKGGVMTAETGTYRWMAPEVINHQPYDHKADVFSFGIVLWELLTARVPYDDMSPVQAALGVRKGLRPETPKDVDPKLLRLMQRCWEEVPSNRPSFTEIRIELEELLNEVDVYTPLI